MGFRIESGRQRRDKNAPQKVSGIGMLLIFIALGVSVALGWWIPLNYDVRGKLPFTATWSTLAIQLVTGVVAFILLQFILVLIQGILFPPQPQDQYDQDGLYIGKREK
jgi:uncharacterized membrane protein YidH (DUF202 family)